MDKFRQTGTQEVKWTGIYVSLPVAAIDQDKAVRKSAVRQQDLVELVVHYLPRHLQIKNMTKHFVRLHFLSLAF